MDKVKKFWTDRRITLAIKWWIAGAVYLLIGWGTQLGTYSYIIDLLFALSIGLFLANRFVYIPIVNNMFNLGPRGENYFNASVVQRLSRNFYELTKNFIVVFIIMLTYNLINAILIVALDLPIDSVVVPGEPILFGLLYVFYTEMMEKVHTKNRRRKVGKQNEKATN